MLSAEGPVLVTGGGGFIGGRIVEILHQLDRPVRATVRRWGSAARIGRLPVPIVRCDVREPDQVRQAMEGAAAVVHCAYGDARTTVSGTRNVLEAASRYGVRRVIHLSTMEVYGDADGDVAETRPTVKTGWEYADSKVEAEGWCREFAGAGLPVTILRPTLVYGPFSRNWTVQIAERLLARGTFPSGADAEGICNLVYVDDVVLACLLSMMREDAVGETFNVNGEERITWKQYLEKFGRALALEPVDGGGRWKTRWRSAAIAPIRFAARTALDHFEEPIMNLYKRSPVVQRWMKSMEATIRQTPSTGEYRLFGRQAYFPIDKARRIVGYEPQFSVDRGLRLSVAWLRYHGFTGPPVTDISLHEPPRARTV